MYKERRFALKTICAYAIFGLAVFILQTCFARGIAIGGIAPVFVIPATICAAMFENERFGAVFGLVLGFLCDVTVGGIMGYYALLLLFVGYFAGKVAQGVSGAGLIPLYIVSFGTYIACVLLLLLYDIIIQGSMAGFGTSIGIYFCEFLYSAPFAAAVYFLCGLVHRRFGGD